MLKCSTGVSGILLHAADNYSVSFLEHLRGMQITTQLPPGDSKKQFKDTKEDFRDIKMKKNITSDEMWYISFHNIMRSIIHYILFFFF